ncbi:carboxypeptidase regulatory-like domain-containing protein [Bacillus megaterium]|nr:carboxypeptidase regulatory-like domain-containing protein [Priestia megaterium]
MPLVGATVHISSQGLISIGNTVSDENGQYRFISIQPGSYIDFGKCNQFCKNKCGCICIR